MQQKIIAILRSDRFFAATVLLLIVQAGWIALTARYPQAFDEQFHFGIIQQYAYHWSPFFTRQPAGADVLGPLTANTSFLYHYLLSWPYRLAALFITHRAGQVIVLRLVNIALFVCSLYIFRRLLLLLPASKALAHTLLFFFVLIPVVPLLAGQINYDNLLMPLAALSLLWMVRFVAAWRRDSRFPVAWALRLLILGLFTVTVKYPYAPMFAAILLTVAYIAWRMRRGLWRSVVRQVRAMPLYGRLLYVIIGMLAIVLVSGSYGRNFVQYHTPLPTCETVLGTARCMAQAPWARDYQFAHDGQPKPSPIGSIPAYDWGWISQSITELVFSISSNFEADGTTVEYHVADPLPVLQVLAWVVFVGGALLIIVFRRQLWQLDGIKLIALVTVLYVGALWAQDYQGYLRTGYPVAIHGRYLLPLLPAWLACIGLSCSWLLRSPRLERMRWPGHVWLVAGAMVLALQGGGFVTYIVRSDASWFWQQGSAAKVNHVVRKALQPVIIGH